MPDFYEKMKNRLRTEDQGADTVVWLAVSREAGKQASGQFFQGKGVNGSFEHGIIIEKDRISCP